MGSAVLDEVLAARPGRQSLDDFESAVDELAALERRVTEKVRAAEEAVRQVLGVPELARRFWQNLLRVPSGELHDGRERVAGLLHLMQQQVEECERRLPEATAVAGRPLAGADRVPTARVELGEFVDRILSRWTSQEELEELMAETFELPAWLTTGPIPPHLQPPQSWYDETIDPSQPADA